MGEGNGHALNERSGAIAAATVRPAGAGLETLCLIAAVIVLLTSTVVLARMNARPEEATPLTDWQLSTIRDLSHTDQAITNALYSAAMMLWVEYEFTKQWTQPSEVQDPEYGYSPFAQDVSWKQMGQVQWHLDKTFSFDGATVYFGNHGKLQDQSAYLLVLSHVHKGYSYANQSVVWIHPDRQIAAPRVVTRDSLIRNGWKEVVPYSGEEEVRRLRGKQ